MSPTHADDTNYDAIAEQYVAHEAPFTRYYERPYMLRQLPPLEGKTVLDVGCASGFYSLHCLEQGARVVSIDASAALIEHTNRLCGHRNTSHVHDIAEPLIFLEDASIDLIIASLVLHYVEDWEGPLEEFHRVLRPGGECLISTHHPINDFRLFNQDRYFDKRLVEDTWKGFSGPLKVRYFVRPLHEYLRPMLSSRLTLVAVDEPLPDPALRDVDEETFKRLSTRPAFLFFRLGK